METGGTGGREDEKTEVSMDKGSEVELGKVGVVCGLGGRLATMCLHWRRANGCHERFANALQVLPVMTFRDKRRAQHADGMLRQMAIKI